LRNFINDLKYFKIYFNNIVMKEFKKANLDNVYFYKIFSKKRKFKHIFFIYIVSSFAFLKYIILYYLFGFEREKIRNRFYGSFWVDRFSNFCRKIRIDAMNWKALDLLYNFRERLSKGKHIERVITNIWFRTKNAKDICYRAIYAKRIIKRIINRKKNNNIIEILSIASGSAQPLFEAIDSFSDEIQKKIKVTLLDLDRTAIKYSRDLHKMMGLKCYLENICESAHVLEKFFVGKKFDIIEMIGFMDYRPKNNAIRLVKKVIFLLKNHGVFITCNIMPNDEKIFLDWVLLWPMIYRREADFLYILKKANFKKNNIFFIFTPNRIHLFAICNKNN